MTYDPGDGSKRRQDIHTKRWNTDEKTARAEARRFIGLEVNGVRVQGASDHVLQRMQERGVISESIMDAIQNPLDIGDIKMDDKGRPFFRVIGKNATLYINPETGIVTTTHSTHNSLAKKLMGRKDGTK